MHVKYCIKKSGIKSEELYLLRTHGKLCFGKLSEAFGSDTQLVVLNHGAEVHTFIKDHPDECSPANLMCSMRFEKERIRITPVS
jgi:hypothetical protein